VAKLMHAPVDQQPAAGPRPVRPPPPRRATVSERTPSDWVDSLAKYGVHYTSLTVIALLHGDTSGSYPVDDWRTYLTVLLQAVCRAL